MEKCANMNKIVPLTIMLAAVLAVMGCTTPPPSIDRSCFPQSVFTAEDMRARVDCHPANYKLEISRDTVVLFAFPDPVIDWVGPIFIIHVPSVSEVVVNTDGSIIHAGYGSPEGRAAIESVLNDPALMAKIIQRAAEIKKAF